MNAPPTRDPVRSAMRVAARQYGLLTLGQARGCGVREAELRRLRRRGAWGRPYPQVYSVRSLLDLTSDDRRMRTTVMGVQLALGPAAFASADTAARLWGLQGLPPWDRREVHVTMPGGPSQLRLPGVELHEWETGTGEVAVHDGLRVTAPGRTLRDLVLRVDRATAVCLIDSALNQGLVQAADLPLLDALNRGRRGCRTARPYWALADGRAQSPLETRIRLICADGGLPPDDLQRPFYLPDQGRTVYGDLWWDDLQVLAEADGAGPHSQPQALLEDRRRQNAILNAYPGIRLVRFSWSDLARPAYILNEIARAGR